MRFLALALLVACGSPAYQTLKLTNRTPREIEAIYVHPVGASSEGSSRGRLAPGKTLDLRVAEGNIEVRAITTELPGSGIETKQAWQTVELRGPTELIFHDSTQTILDRPGTIGVAFRVVP